MSYQIRFREGQEETWQDWTSSGLPARSGDRYGDRIFELINIDLECEERSYRGLIELNEELEEQTGMGVGEMLAEHLDEVASAVSEE
jgi:hypothetical protein